MNPMSECAACYNTCKECILNNKTMKKSQNKLILEHLQLGYHLSPLYALKKFDSLRLSARIKDLRYLGHDIKTEMVKYEGKRFALYCLPK